MFETDKLYIPVDMMDDDGDPADLITLMSKEDEDEMERENDPKELSILPLRNTVLFPGVVVPITVGRDKSIKLIRQAYKKDKIIGVTSQRDSSIEDPEVDDLFEIGTLAHIVRMLRMPDGNITAIIQGKKKFSLDEIVGTDPYFKARVTVLKDSKAPKNKEFNALLSSVRELAVNIVNMSPNIPTEANFALKNIDSPNFLINFIASHLNIDIDDKQAILETTDLQKRAKIVLQHLTREMQMLELKNQIQSKVKVDLDKQQREYFLHQQIRAIQEELGQDSPDKEIEKLRARGKKKKWSKEVGKAFDKELDKLLRMNPAAPDYSVSLNYVELLLELPWNEFTKDRFDVERARKVLDADHFGLEKVKERILEYLAVLKLKGDMKSPILCLYGPPGVGKTSLGKSIAKAVGRKYERMSLGGLHDEAELRGHRKTYIGAMPGRIIQALKKTGTSNPVIVLDEIDKIGNDFRGDPSSALLEVLDPEQNSAFHDNYVELDYDLSRVMFITTANRLDTIQPALRDRMEIIEINGYTVEEKLQIGKRYLVPKQRKAHGLKAKQFNIPDRSLLDIIEHYTRESGVRGLEKHIATLARNRAKEVVNDNFKTSTVSLKSVASILGSQRIEKDIYESNDIAGVVPGLAWTAVGGEILFVESRLTKGKGKFTLTGQLGDIMKESAVTASTFLKANSDYLEIDPRIFDHYDIHLHFPAGAVPKDGPSAGITILTSMASTVTQRKVKSHLAMTGEITLRGKVLPVGGIKEKILAAKRAGIKEVVLSSSNKKDIDDIAAEYLEDLEFHFVNNMLEVLDIALLDEKVEQAEVWEIPDKNLQQAKVEDYTQ